MMLGANVPQARSITISVRGRGIFLQAHSCVATHTRPISRSNAAQPDQAMRAQVPPSNPLFSHLTLATGCGLIPPHAEVSTLSCTLPGSNTALRLSETAL